MAEDKVEVKFLTIDQFKELVGAESATVLKNHKTGKLFLSASNGETYKVQQDIDPEDTMKVLVPNDDVSEACLINVSSEAETMFTI